MESSYVEALEQIKKKCGRKNGGCDILSRQKFTFDGAAESRTSQNGPTGGRPHNS